MVIASVEVLSTITLLKRPKTGGEFSLREEDFS
jgi:hypothetical protein